MLPHMSVLFKRDFTEGKSELKNEVASEYMTGNSLTKLPAGLSIE